jgi:hypothetical protein
MASCKKLPGMKPFQTAADSLGSIIKAYGPDGVGVLASAKVTNEENYQIQKFAMATSKKDAKGSTNSNCWLKLILRTRSKP